jgi:hypothetical protein
MKHHLWIGSLAAAFAVSSAVGITLLAQQAHHDATPQAGAAADSASKPTPKLADGHPDLNGTWELRDGGITFLRPQKLANGSVCIINCAGGLQLDANGNPVPAGGAPAAARPSAPPPAPPFPKYKPEFLAKVKDLSDRQVQTDSLLRCEAPGVPRIGPPAKIVQTPREVVFLYDDVNGGFFRVIPTDGRPHRKGLPDSYLGDAIGHWDGETLVVETVNFNDETWLIDNGAFHTKNLRVVERLHRTGDTIDFRATAYDPTVLAEPWNLPPRTMWKTNRELEEPSRCQDRDLEHIVDGSHHDNAR